MCGWQSHPQMLANGQWGNAALIEPRCPTSGHEVRLPSSADDRFCQVSTTFLWGRCGRRGFLQSCHALWFSMQSSVSGKFFRPVETRNPNAVFRGSWFSVRRLSLSHTHHPASIHVPPSIGRLPNVTRTIRWTVASNLDHFSGLQTLGPPRACSDPTSCHSGAYGLRDALFVAWKARHPVAMRALISGLPLWRRYSKVAQKLLATRPEKSPAANPAGS